MTGERDGTRGPFTLDPEEAARLAQNVQDLGFEAARTVIDRFAELYNQFCANATGWPGTATTDPARGAGTAGRTGTDPSGYPRLQSDVQRATEAYVAVLQQLNEASRDFFDATRAARRSQPVTERLVLPGVAPGGRSSGRLWLHNTTESAVTGVRPWTRKLVSHTGRRLPAATVAFTPHRIERLDAGQSLEIVVTARLVGEQVPGIYHGEILVEGLPATSIPLELHVLPGATGRDRPGR